MISSKNMWMYATIGLVAMFAFVMGTTPQASAAAKDLHQQILDAVNTKASQTSVNTLQSTVNTIDTKTTNIQNAIELQGAGGSSGLLLDTTVFGNDGDISNIVVLPASQDKLYVGHIIVTSSGDGQRVLSVDCIMADFVEQGLTIRHGTGGGPGAVPFVETDFYCTGLVLTVIHQSSSPVLVLANVVYHEVPAEFVID